MPLTRSEVMARVKARDTRPELIVRRLLHAAGYRYRLHARDLAGTPDLVFRSRRVALFVHGCFWHGHDCPRGAREPVANADYWRAKIARNRARDAAAQEQLLAAGWTSTVVWECELSDRSTLFARLAQDLATRENAAIPHVRRAPSARSH